jgi:hypothetical protein
VSGESRDWWEAWEAWEGFVGLQVMAQQALHEDAYHEFLTRVAERCEDEEYRLDQGGKP